VSKREGSHHAPLSRGGQTEERIGHALIATQKLIHAFAFN
jgi:hypothetical protein